MIPALSVLKEERTGYVCIQDATRLLVVDMYHLIWLMTIVKTITTL